MENELVAFFAAVGQTFYALWQEVSLIEGDSLKEQWLWIVDRMTHERSTRILWLLISGLTCSIIIFLLSASVALYEAIAIPTRRSKARTRRPSKRSNQNLKLKSNEESDKQLSETLSWAQKVAPRNVVGKLKAGQIDAAESELFEMHKRKPDDVGIIMYLLACRAIQHDIESYETLVNEIFPDGLKAGEAICQHAAELGRLLAEDRFPQSDIPNPESAFEVDAELIGDTLGPITEFGSVQTLLDLVRVYFDMDDVDEIRHLVVEVLVAGSAQERKSALKYAQLLRQKTRP